MSDTFLPHAHWMEFVWVGFAVACCWLTFVSLLHAWWDYQRTKRELSNGVFVGNRLILSQAIVTSTGLLLLVTALILTDASAALFLSPPPPSYALVPQTIFGIVCRLLMTVTLATQALYSLVIRKKLFGPGPRG